MAFFLHPADTAFGIALLFLAGVFITGLGWHFLAFFLAALLGGVGTILWRRQLWKECILFLCAALVGALYYHFYFHLQALETNLPTGQEASLQVVISDEPQPTEKYLIITTDAAPPFWGTLKILAPPGSNFQYGELLQVSGAISPPDTEGGDSIVFSPKSITVLAEHRGFWLREWMINLKLAILQKFREVLPEDQAALLGGIAFGSKVSFKQELKNAMALSGTTHLVAVSGYNITIVIVAAGDLFKRFASRRATFFAAVIALVLFMFMVGAQASAVRAAIMGFLALIAREIGEQFSMRNAIVFTAAFMALLDPSVLTGNISFILSFLSLAGIVYLGPPLQKLLRYSGESGLFDWKESAITTMSAQLAVMPALINSFGRFSCMAIFANILVLSTVPLTMFLGALLALFGFVSHYLAFFAGKLVGLFLAYQLFVIRLFAALAVPLPLPLNSAAAIALYYVILLIFIFSYGAHDRSQRI